MKKVFLLITLTIFLLGMAIADSMVVTNSQSSGGGQGGNLLTEPLEVDDGCTIYYKCPSGYYLKQCGFELVTSDPVCVESNTPGAGLLCSPGVAKQQCVCEEDMISECAELEKNLELQTNYASIDKDYTNSVDKVNCESYTYTNCPSTCTKKCVPSKCIETPEGITCTSDCGGPGSCYLPKNEYKVGLEVEWEKFSLKSGDTKEFLEQNVFINLLDFEDQSTPFLQINKIYQDEHLLLYFNNDLPFSEIEDFVHTLGFSISESNNFISLRVWQVIIGGVPIWKEVYYLQQIQRHSLVKWGNLNKALFLPYEQDSELRFRTILGIGEERDLFGRGMIKTFSVDRDNNGRLRANFGIWFDEPESYDESASGEIIIMFYDYVTEDEANELIESFGLNWKESFPKFIPESSFNWGVINVEEGKEQQFIIMLQNQEIVSSAELNRILKPHIEDKEYMEYVFTISDCPANCVCNKEAINCLEEKNLIQVEVEATKKSTKDVETSHGSFKISKNRIEISKLNQEMTLLKSKNVEVIISSPIRVIESKLFVGEKNQMISINVLPDEVVSNSEIDTLLSIELKEDNGRPTYFVFGKSSRKLVSIIPVMLKIKTKIDPETGNIIFIEKPWWSFLTTK